MHHCIEIQIQLNDITDVFLWRPPSCPRLSPWRGYRTSLGSWWCSSQSSHPQFSCSICSSSSSICRRTLRPRSPQCPTAPWSAEAGAKSSSFEGTWEGGGAIETASRWWLSRRQSTQWMVRRLQRGPASQPGTGRTLSEGKSRSTGRGRRRQTSGILRYSCPTLWPTWWAPGWRGSDKTIRYPWCWRRNGKVQSRRK